MTMTALITNAKNSTEFSFVQYSLLNIVFRAEAHAK